LIEATLVNQAWLFSVLLLAFIVSNKFDVFLRILSLVDIFDLDSLAGALMASSKRPWKIAQAVETFSKLGANKVCSPSQVVCEKESGKASSWDADGSGLHGCLALLGGSRRHLHRSDRL
jgi:hypothetical protein